MSYDFPENIGTQRYDDDLNAIFARLQKTPLPKNPIAFYGSSSFRFWTTMSDDLQTLDAVNLGFGGGTNASGIHYVERLLFPLNPVKVFLYFGENDIAADGLGADTTFAHFSMLLDRIREGLGDVPVYALSTKQSRTRWIYADSVDRYNHLVRARCAAETNTHFVDVGTPLLGEHGLPTGKYYIGDGIHLGAAGYRVWADILRPLLAEA